VRCDGGERGRWWRGRRQLALALGVEAQGSFPGLQTPEQIGRLDCAAAVPSCSTRTRLQYGTRRAPPVAVMEAQLSGLPVVPRAMPDSEVVLEGGNGLLVEEGDRDGMAAAIGRLPPALLEHRGRARCSAQFHR